MKQDRLWCKTHNSPIMTTEYKIDQKTGLAMTEDKCLVAMNDQSNDTRKCEAETRRIDVSEAKYVVGYCNKTTCNGCELKDKCDLKGGEQK